MEGFHARVVQHECDHLIGKLYPMRVRDFTQFGFTEVLFPGLDAGRRLSVARQAGLGQRLSSSVSISICVAVLLQFRAVDQEGVFHPLAQRGDLGQLQVDAGASPAPVPRIQQADTVAGR